MDDALLKCYRQREWRIIPGFVVGGICYCTPLTAAAQKEKLLATDERFWGSKFPDAGSNTRRVDEAFIIENVMGNTFQS